MTTIHRALAAAIASAILLSSAAATAEPAAPPDVVRADRLFQDATALIAARNFADACPMFAESYRLDPAGGTLQNLAMCNEELGQWASAYARFEELRAISIDGSRPRPDRVKLAEEHLAKLAPRVTRVVVVVPREIEDGAAVTIDGAAIPKARLSTGVPVDPGPHEVTVTAKGMRPFHARVEATDGGELRVPVDVQPDAPATKTAPPATPTPTPPPPEPPRSTFPTAGVAIGAAGLAALGTGAVFGVLTITTSAKADDACSSQRSADVDPVAMRCFAGTPTLRKANGLKDDARTYANVANVLVPLGVIGTAVGAYLILRRPPPGGVSARVAPTPGGAMIEGTF